MSYNTYQPFLDYGLIPNPAVIFPTVIENYDWGIFVKNISKKYYQALSDFLERQNKAMKKLPIPQYGQELFPYKIHSDPKKNNREKNPRNAGRCPMDFLSLFKSFTCVRYMDIDVNSRTVYSLLNSNPAFLERMNFNNRTPSFRTIDRFDQIMTEYDLWEKAAFVSIRVNIIEAVINPDEECVIIVDTTHIQARAKKGKAIKPCREYPFYKTCTGKVPTDDNAGILTKSKNEKHFAHKVGLLTPAKASLPTNFFVNRGETFDGHFLEPLLGDFIRKLPQFDNIDYVVADGTFGSRKRESFVKEKLDAQLVTPINPRKSKEVKTSCSGH